MNFTEWWKNEGSKVYYPEDEWPCKAAWNAALENQWQPIESARKDGTLIVLYNKGSGDMWIPRSITRSWWLEPWILTHWMPLPEPPQEEL